MELVLMWPFVWLGKCYGWLFPLKTRHNAFLFYPNGDIGGSPRVNIDIAECIKDAHPLIIFSKKPKNNQFRELYNIPGVRVIDLQALIDKKALHFINFFFRGVIAAWINRESNPVVFGGESMFFYKIVPHVRKNIRCVELCHLATWIHYTLAFINRIDLRIFSTLKLKENVEALYKENHVPAKLYDRLLFIDNAIDIPEYKEITNPVLEVVFIGRGSPQKRVPLIAAMAQRMHEHGDRVHFSFVGDVEKVINIDRYPYCKFYGNVNDNALMEQIYQQSDVLLLTSAFEGLPIVVMKMMAYGKVVVSTAVNGIPDYIKHQQNGLLIHATDEEAIIAEGVELLRYIIAHPSIRIQLGHQAHLNAAALFSKEVFCKTYRRLLLDAR
jgi:glycosyltransferase involved in cell wall biosynthesis